MQHTRLIVPDETLQRAIRTLRTLCEYQTMNGTTGAAAFHKRYKLEIWSTYGP